MVCGSRICTVERSPSALTTTLQGSSTPMLHVDLAQHTEALFANSSMTLATA
jgi:hypothetical protein